MGQIKPLYDNVRLNCVITSDNHIDIKHPQPRIPQQHLERSLYDSQNSSVPMDAYISVGDVTSRGNSINWGMAEDCFKKYSPAKNILLCFGNHDTWHDGGYNAALEEYYSYSEKICGERPAVPYFSKVINGYYLIFLGSTADDGCEAHFGDEEISWFDGEMEKAAAGGKPVFVFNHQSLNCRHGLPVTWDESGEYGSLSDGGIGAESEKIEKILKKCGNVFFFSGHSHMGLCGEPFKEKEGYSTFETDGGLTLINLPSLACRNHHGETFAKGIGLVMEVYDGRVVLRPRSFDRHAMNRKIIIKDGKPYFEKVLG